MKTKKKSRKTQKAVPPVKDRSKPSESSEDDHESGSMDFGGLPERDLKKNLGGCG